MIIVDSSVWIDALQGRVTAETSWLDRHLTDTVLGLTDLILCEILQGVRQDASFEPFRADLMQFTIHDTGGADIALAAARNYRKLRAGGVTIRSTIDCIIATYCIREGYSLLHRDRDFDSFEKHLGLRVIHA